MKKIVLSLSLLLSAFVARAQTTTLLTGMDYASTNSFIVDASRSSAFGLQVAFTGAGDHTTTAIVGVTNNPAHNSAIGLTVAGATTVYTWTTNAVQVYQTNYSGGGTNLTMPISRGTTNGDYVSIILNGNTNTFTFTNTPTATTDVLTNTTAAGSATNRMLVMGAFYNILSVNNTNVILASGVAGNISETDSGISGTETYAVYYTVTNLVATNSHQIAVGATSAASTTNLAASLATDYSTALAVSYTAATRISLVTLGNPGFTLTNSTAWATNLITTNAITGSLTFTASNSLDKITWFPDTAKNFTLPYNTNLAVSCKSNWTSIGADAYWQFTVANSSTNYAAPQGLSIKSSVKQGF